MSVLLSRSERRHLINLLLRVQFTESLHGRLTLLGGLPPNLLTGIPEIPDARTHITAIVDIADSAAWVVLPDGTRTVAVIIENAREAVAGSTLAEELGSLLDVLGTRPLPTVPLAGLPTGPSQDQMPALLGELRRLLVEVQEQLSLAITVVDRLQEQPEQP